MNKNIPSLTWWSLSQEKIIELLHIDPKKGLSNAQVKEYGKKFGSNTIAVSKPLSFIALISEGVQEPMMLLLLIVAALALVFGKINEAVSMIFVVMAYILVELLNKYKSDRTMEKLKALTAPTAKVIREGKINEILTRDIIIGDILVLSEGVVVSADARLLSSYGLAVNEASLTGESLPIQKNATVQLPQNALLTERVNCVFSGTTVLTGEGLAVVVAIGEKSELGKIAQKTQVTTKEKTVLQESMTKLAKIIAIFALGLSALIPAIGYLQGLSFEDMVLTWLSLTFLMIPGQPPIIITMALALAAFALARKQIIVKRLRGIEILGQVTSIMSDKTGTITESSMVLETFFTSEGEKKELSEDMQEQILLAIPDYCSDPTDRAVSSALKSANEKLKQINYNGFSNNKSWRDLVYKKNEIIIHAITGSPEVLITHSTLPLDCQKKLIDKVKYYASLGKRITAYASIENNQQQLDNLQNLTFIALAVISDPIRPGVKKAIATLKHAHIHTIIVTGDHKETAKAIADEIGITGEVITGDQLEKMNDKELVANIGQSNIFAHIDPIQKLRLVKVLQQQGEIVAAIGDGINDAPALKVAQVGIAMGKIGTDLAKEVSDLILTDDNYIHIPEAIATSRKALDNFKKGITYYLSAKSILLIIFLVPLLLAIPFPFAPIQIILIEILMDLASSTIFITEEAEPDIMQKPAQKMKDFIGKPLLFKIIKNGLPLTVGIIFLYLRSYQKYDITTAQTTALVAWLLGHILLALNLKQEQKPLIIQGISANYFGFFWLCAMVALSLIITSVPLLYPYTKTTWLSIYLWIEIIIVVCIATLWIEIVKLLKLKNK